MTQLQMVRLQACTTNVDLWSSTHRLAIMSNSPLELLLRWRLPLRQRSQCTRACIWGERTWNHSAGVRFPINYPMSPLLLKPYYIINLHYIINPMTLHTLHCLITIIIICFRWARAISKDQSMRHLIFNYYSVFLVYIGFYSNYWEVSE